MALTDYTTYDSIRAVLGVSAKEAKDATLALPLFETQFLLELSDVDGGVGAVRTQYTTIKALAPAGRTATQQRLLDVVNMLAAYSVARQLLTGAALAFPQHITDGKAAIERFSDDTFALVREGVTGTYGQLMRRLKAILISLVPGASVASIPARTFMSSVGLGTDPVTGV